MNTTVRGVDVLREKAAQSAPRGAIEPLPQELIAELRLILGEQGVIADPGALLVWESDGLTAYRVTPRAVLLPRTTDETARTLQILAREKIPFVPRGAGTGLSGGALALEGAVSISFSRMKRILEIDPANRRARVQPGVVNTALSVAAQPYGLYYAPDPSSQTVCTIGGNVAENAGGPHCLKYGVTMNHIISLTVVLPSGAVVQLGPQGGETIGYDLVGLFIGSEGTFGIATEIVVRLLPIPEAVETVVALFDRIDDASRVVSEIIAAGMLPAALEMVDRQAIIAIEASAYAAGLPTDIGGILLVEFDGRRAGLASDADRAVQLCKDGGAREVRRAHNAEERQRMWYARKKAFGAMGRLAPDILVQDAVVPRSKLPAVLNRIYEIAEQHHVILCNMFHAGDGNLHPTIAFDRRNPEQVAAVHEASRKMMHACVEAGGTITGEHGVGLDKRQYMELVFSEAEMSAMCAVRDVFNPTGLANPAKILPLHVCREWAGPATNVEGEHA
ncbi:MAG TPA: FAD-linked oxidase C-terminal domain-containing protein [Longimicrobiales bacterium]